MSAAPITGVVLAAGASRRLGTPKQLLPYRETTVLGATLDVTRSCRFHQNIVTLGGNATNVRATVPLEGFDVVVAEDFGSGCSSSLRIALSVVDERAAGIVLMLGDQPGVSAATVETLLGEATSSAIAVCRYDDGIGHPFWLGRGIFGELARLHGDKDLWNLIRSGRVPVREVAVGGCLPIDVDTWDDYERLIATVQP
jgi:molybdenum cofactor cytidylyltransferase